MGNGVGNGVANAKYIVNVDHVCASEKRDCGARARSIPLDASGDAVQKRVVNEAPV